MTKYTLEISDVKGIEISDVMLQYNKTILKT